jgi:hypothetical protein
MKIDSEYAFDDQSEVIADHALHIEKISFTDFSRFPKWLAVADIFIVQWRKIP